MADAPTRYVDWINQHVGFNPRGQSHSDFLTACIIEDLRARCPPLLEHFEDRLWLAQNVGTGGKRHASPVVARPSDVAEDDEQEIDPNIDGVVLRSGTEVSGAVITLENKTIMTAHGKARTNRFNDARAYATHVHNNNPLTIAAFTIVVNTAPTYKNPDAFARSAKSSGTNTSSAIAGTFQLFQTMRLRDAPTNRVSRCEAVFILGIDYDGQHPTARLVTEPPGPVAGSPYSYDAFLERICRLYQERFE